MLAYPDCPGKETIKWVAVHVIYNLTWLLYLCCCRQRCVWSFLQERPCQETSCWEERIRRCREVDAVKAETRLSLVFSIFFIVVMGKLWDLCEVLVWLLESHGCGMKICMDQHCVIVGTALAEKCSRWIKSRCRHWRDVPLCQWLSFSVVVSFLLIHHWSVQLLK